MGPRLRHFAAASLRVTAISSQPTALEGPVDSAAAVDNPRRLRLATGSRLGARVAHRRLDNPRRSGLVTGSCLGARVAHAAHRPGDDDSFVLVKRTTRDETNNEGGRRVSGISSD
jgi:hypothetical protein